VSNFEFDTSQYVVGSFEVVELNYTNFFGNGTISSVLPTSKVVEIGSEWSVLMVWICFICEVSDDWSTRIFSWNHIMKDSQTISTV